MVPCHRVVASDGQLTGFKGASSGKELVLKETMLRNEGVAIAKGKVLKESFFDFGSISSSSISKAEITDKALSLPL